MVLGFNNFLNYIFNFKTNLVFDGGRERTNQSQKAQKTCIIKIEPNWANWSTFSNFCLVIFQKGFFEKFPEKCKNVLVSFWFVNKCNLVVISDSCCTVLYCTVLYCNVLYCTVLNTHNFYLLFIVFCIVLYRAGSTNFPSAYSVSLMWGTTPKSRKACVNCHDLKYNMLIREVCPVLAVQYVLKQDFKLNRN